MSEELNYFGQPISRHWFTLKPHELQIRAYTSDKRVVFLPCGRGSGKTEISRRRVVRHLAMKKEWPDPMYFYALPTFAQAKRVAWRPLLNLIPKSWIHRISESDLFVQTVFGSWLYVVGMDKPQRIEGNQWDGGVIDESSDQKPKTFDLSVVPALVHRKGWCHRIGVPKRTGIGAREFKRGCEIAKRGENPDWEHFAWPSSDIVDAEFLETAKRSLDPRDYAEQFEASWLTAGGKIFWAFEKSRNVRKNTYDPTSPIIVGSDFNVNPMAWTISHLRNDCLFTFDEIWLRDTNTRNTLDELYRRYGKHSAGWIFTGDAAGRQRHPSASITDYIQIKNDTRFKNAEIRYLGSNPLRKDRFASCNAMLLNAADEVRAFIDPRCVHLIAELEDRSYREGTSEPDDSDKDMGHITDAWGYKVHRLFPLRLDSDEMQTINVSVGVG